MSKRKSAAAAAVEFFQTAPIDTAREVLAICAHTVKARSGDAPKRTSKPKPAAPTTVTNGVQG